jgi:photosystem II stability/assembly factor-like uncharacterized protein
MTQALTSKMGALWIQPEGPNTESYYLDCKDLGDIGIPEGAMTLIRCFRADGSGWDTVGSTQAPPEAVTFDVTGLMFNSRDWLEKVKCPFSMYALQRNCGRADNFSNYVRGFGFHNVRRTNRSYSGIVSREEDTQSSFSVSLEAYPPVYEIEELTIGSIVSAATENLNDVVMNADYFCYGDCGDTEPSCELGMIAGDSAVGPALADILQTTDAGITWTQVAANPFAAGLDAKAVATYLVGSGTRRYLVAREGTGAAVQGLVAYTDDNGATWTTASVGGAAEGHGAVRGGGLFALDERHIWLASAAGYIYFSSDGGETWAAQEEGAIGVTDYNQVHFEPSGQYGIAGSAADVIIVSSNGGETWTAATATGGGGDILCCQRLDHLRAWVGDDDGNLWYTRDGGVTWTQRTGWVGSGIGDVTDLHFVNDHIAFMLHNTAAPVGTVLYTFDGGYTWIPLTTPTNVGLNAVYACDASQALVVGKNNAGAAVILRVTAV